VGVIDLTLTALGKNTVKWEMCFTAAVLHILVAGNLATSSMISSSISSLVSSFSALQTQMSLFSSGADECNCFSLLKLASVKCFLVNMMYYSFIVIFISKHDVHISFLHQCLFIDRV